MFEGARLRRWLWRALAAGLVTAILVPSLAVAAELLPDLESLPPTDIFLDRGEDDRHLLRFTQGIANAGKGQLRVRGVMKADGVADGYQEIIGEDGNVARSVPTASVVYHPHHAHWHAGDVASYELRQGSPDGPIVARNGKISYCFVDDEPLRGFRGTAGYQRYFNCRSALMGITPGWVDVYRSHLYDQWIDITDVPDGAYYMVIEADPSQVYVEATRENNIAWVKVEFTKATRTLRIMTPNEIIVQVDGKRVDFPVPPRLIMDRSFVPVRLAERLGAKVTWDGTNAMIAKGDKRIAVTADDGTAMVNEITSHWMDGLAYVERDDLVLPARFLAEQLGAQVSYDWAASTLVITTGGAAPAGA